MVGLTGAAALQAVALLFPYINIVSHHKLQTYIIAVLKLLGAKIGVIGNNDMYTATTISFPKRIAFAGSSRLQQPVCSWQLSSAVATYKHSTMLE